MLTGCGTTYRSRGMEKFLYSEKNLFENSPEFGMKRFKALVNTEIKKRDEKYLNL